MGRKRKRESPALAVAARINAQMGRDIVTVASGERFRIKRVPIGIHTLMRITGGGFARGRHVELFGDENAGKSLIMYLTMALAQQRGEICAIVDSEHVFDEEWFAHLGGDPGDLLGFHPKTAEEVIKTLMLFAQPVEDMPGVSIVGVDSVASLLPQEELAKDVEEGDDRTASRARMMSRALRRVTTVNRDTLFIWTNQTIDKIGSYVGGVTTPGGRALRFYASTRIEVRKSEKVKEERNVVKKGKIVKTPKTVGHWVQVRSEKEKTARPYQEGMFYFNTEKGQVDHDRDLLDLLLGDGFVERSGNSYVYIDGDNQEWSGTLKTWKGWLAEEPELRQELVWIVEENTRLLAGVDNDGE